MEEEEEEEEKTMKIIIMVSWVLSTLHCPYRLRIWNKAIR
jgi:hypothetical protein